MQYYLFMTRLAKVGYHRPGKKYYYSCSHGDDNNLFMTRLAKVGYHRPEKNNTIHVVMVILIIFFPFFVVVI